MPNTDPTVTASNARKTGKDQGNINVVYRGSRGRTFLARVVSVASQLTAVAGTAVAPQGTTGAVTYRYRVAPVDAEGGEGVAAAGTTIANGNATLDETNFNRVTWSAKTGASSYRVYGRTGADGAVGLLAQVTGTTYDDDGTDTPGAVVPTFTADRLRLMIRSGSRILKNNVPKATSAKQSHAYFNR